MQQTSKNSVKGEQKNEALIVQSVSFTVSLFA